MSARFPIMDSIIYKIPALIFTICYNRQIREAKNGHATNLIGLIPGEGKFYSVIFSKDRLLVCLNSISS